MAIHLVYPWERGPSLADLIAAESAVECAHCSDLEVHPDYWTPGAGYDAHVAQCLASAELIDRWAEPEGQV